MNRIAADLRRVVAGEVCGDPPELRDHGQVLARRPAVVVRPAGGADVAAVVRYAAARGIPVSPRGTAHSLRGQSANDGGVVLDLTGLADLVVDPRRRVFRCGPGVRWRSVVAAAAEDRLAPPVLTGYPHVTVGGTHAVGGWGDASFRFGAQVDNCTGLEVVTGTGERVWCSREEQPEVFCHVLGGMGQFGVITAVEHRLRRYRPVARTYPLSYDDLDGMLADARRMVAADSPLDSLECMIEAGSDGSWRYRMLATVESDGVAPAGCPVSGLVGRAGPATDRPTAESLAQPEVNETPARPGIAQPWVVAFLPWSEAREYLDVCLHRLPRGLLGGTQARVRLWPARREVTAVPMFRVPEVESEMIMVGIFPSVPAGLLPAALAVLSRVSDLALDAGGTRHLGTWVHLDRPRWRRHYGSHWASVNDLKHRLDPAGVLNPGLIDFEPRQNRVPHPKKGAEPGSVA